MNTAENEPKLQDLLEEKAEIAGRSHQGYADVARMLKVEEEIEAIEQDIARDKQVPHHGEG